MFKRLLLATAILATCALPAVAQVKVGVITGATGPGASLGIPYKNTFTVLPKTLGGQPVQYIILDDATDPTNAVKLARKLVVEDKVDLLIGSSSVPAATAITDVAAELKTPQIALSPVGAAAAKNPWVYSIPQPASLMMGAVAEDMKARKVKRVAYIGFNDSWGDLVLSGLKANAEAAGITIVADERYARLDTSVAGQVLKVVASNPDAVVVGGSGTPGALPQMTLVERGYKGPVYHNHGIINKDFLRVGGKALEGAMAPTGPVMVAEQLPDSNPVKKTSLEFTKLYEGAFGAGTRNAFSAYSYDAYLLADKAVQEAMKKAKPGTPEFRQALRDALEQTKEVVGTHGVYNMSATDHAGVDSRARVLVRVENGDWKLVKSKAD
ncbi:ABC transporter substrate-binding protein [Variovorax sp. YR216]|uniref:ABC transporter substrate-binding protein n=1 Tax=Variovorax sp. YR216 TaxID=1882828 RepID=UPI0008988BBF|nr:ABC transporter substrate-binding protein [Variovorax sp. YR216]SEA86891.1 amino acid/amide ABC transporter substrate-binding protein, HAAT family [Variovorax sp. YR216]